MGVLGWVWGKRKDLCGQSLLNGLLPSRPSTNLNNPYFHYGKDDSQTCVASHSRPLSVVQGRLPVPYGRQQDHAASYPRRRQARHLRYSRARRGHLEGGRQHPRHTFPAHNGDRGRGHRHARGGVRGLLKPPERNQRI